MAMISFLDRIERVSSEGVHQIQFVEISSGAFMSDQIANCDEYSALVMPLLPTSSRSGSFLRKTHLSF